MSQPAGHGEKPPQIAALPSIDPPTVVGSLDMARHEDRRVLVRSVTDGAVPGNTKRRWGNIDDEMKERFVKALGAAMRMALEKSDHRAVASCVDTLSRLEGQNQADEHLAEKHRRLDSGQATEVNEIVVRHERKPLAEHGPG